MTLNEFKKELENNPKKRVWLFNSAGTFSGNVKYLFLYIYLNRHDIYPFYISGDKDNVERIKNQGYPAVTFDSEDGKYLMSKCEVYVNEQCKEHYPSALCSKKILNLYHGVGLKEIEREWKRDFLGERMAKKYIEYNDVFRNNMCFLVTSPFMESHFKKQLDLRNEQIIRGGYPRNIFHQVEKNYKKHNQLLRNADEKLIIYTPTYRESSPVDILNKAIPEPRKLNEILKQINSKLYIKLHPKITQDRVAKELEQRPLSNLKIWDDDLDIYDYIDEFDVAIVDYSSIFYDFVEAGVKKYIRYIFDIKEESRFLLYDYEENTTGKICKSFSELIETLRDDNLDFEDSKKLSEIIEKFWKYSSKNTFEEIIEQTNSFEIVQKKWPTLYSFDIFDTLIHRKCGNPGAIFIEVQENLSKCGIAYPYIFYKEYARIRKQAEANEREKIKKTKGWYEINYKNIYKRIQNIYDLTNEQRDNLENLEFKAELQNVTLDREIYSEIKKLKECNEKVILISDMYLPKYFIQSLIERVAPDLLDLEIFVSSEREVQKSSGKLYLQIYREFSPWIYSEWIHTGDSKKADYESARNLGIKAKFREHKPFNKFENDITRQFQDSDIFKIANILRSVRSRIDLDDKSYFAISLASLIFVPYLKWCIEHAIKQGTNTLYFITRDGLILKAIADKVIEAFGYSIETKLIYGSRKAWRLAAIYQPIDEEFFSDFGNFVGVDTSEKFYQSLKTTKGEFSRAVPEVEVVKTFTTSENAKLREILKRSENFKAFLINKAKRERELAIEYLEKNINFAEKFAFVEFWGRGYTQTCLTNILKSRIVDCETVFYYYRSILESEPNNIRNNYSEENTSLLFVEAMFANVGMQSVERYEKLNGNVLPIFKEQNYDIDLHAKIIRFAEVFIDELKKIRLAHKTSTLRMASAFAVRWLYNNPSQPTVYKSIAHLKDSVELWGNLREFAPSLSKTDCEMLVELVKRGKGTSTITRSIEMSLARSTKEVKDYWIKLGNNKVLNIPTSSSTDASREYSNKLRKKLEQSPILYCRDSKNLILRCLSKIMKPNSMVTNIVQGVLLRHYS